MIIRDGINTSKLQKRVKVSTYEIWETHDNNTITLSVRYTTTDIHCRDRRYECDGGIN